MPFEVGVAHYDEPPPEVLEDLDALREADRFRFANRLNAWIAEAFDRGTVGFDTETDGLAAHRANPNTVVYIRADENGRNKDLYAVIDRCQRNGITRFSLRTDPTKTP